MVKKLNTLFRIVIPALTCLLFFTSCTEEKPEREIKSQEEKVKILLGLIPEQNIFNQINRYNHIAGYLKSKSNIEIEFMILTRYGNIVSNFKELGLDGAFFGSFVYTIAHSELGVVPIARPVNNDGSSSYHGLIFLRTDSGLNKVEDLRGKTFAFVDKATTAGYLLPLAYFRYNGIADYQTFFKKTYFTGTHEGAINDVLDKHADIGAAKNTVFYRLARSNSKIKNELQIIARSPDVPENSLALRPDIDDKIKNGIKQALLNMHLDPQGKETLKAFGAVKFIETTNSDYEPVYNYAKKIGLDLSNYNYTND